MKKFKFVHPTDRMLIFILLTIIGLMTAILLFFGWRINMLERSLNCGNTKISQQSCISWFPIKVYIQNAVESLYQSAGTIDPYTNRVMFPEARIYVPLSADAKDVRYFYSKPQTPSDDNILQTNSYSNMQSLIGSFDDVPCIQKFVDISIDKPAKTDLEPAGTLKLQDGRTLYFYKNNNKACREVTHYLVDKTLDIFKQAKSY
ncbi:hypothetical protein KW792_01540 [Candidatus Saccharibacteria bacterium]|nr:hypothetical protein [Candidatus Saccharibacteria bacterium]